jgi:hypothetical protein
VEWWEVFCLWDFMVGKVIMCRKYGFVGCVIFVGFYCVLDI